MKKLAWEGIYFKAETVLAYFQKHPDHLNLKKFHELLIGWILLQFFEEQLRSTLYLGFPAMAGSGTVLEESPKTLAWLLDNQDSAIDDTDTDVLIGNKENWLKLQITRYFYPEGITPDRGLVELIQKKCHKYGSQTDTYLVVSIEKKPHVTESGLRKLLEDTRIPFRGIFLVQKSSRRRGHFKYIRLFPKPWVSKSIQLPLPM